MGLKKYLGSLRGLKINKIIDLGHGLWRMDRWDSKISRIYKLYLDSFKTPCIWQVHAPPPHHIFILNMPLGLSYVGTGRVVWRWVVLQLPPALPDVILFLILTGRQGSQFILTIFWIIQKYIIASEIFYFIFYQKWSLIYEPKRHND